MIQKIKRGVAIVFSLAVLEFVFLAVFGGGMLYLNYNTFQDKGTKQAMVESMTAGE